MATLSITRPCCFTALFFLLYSSSLVLSQVFEMVPSDLEVNETDEVTFSCSYPGAIISWSFEEMPISLDDPGFVISQSGDGSQSNVTITADHNIHNGSYCCLATIGVDTFSSNFTITVNYLDNPVSFGVTIEPDECAAPTVYQGSTVTLTCEAPDGFPMPSVAWFHNDFKIRRGSFLEFSSMKRVARITNVQSNSGGEYRCEVSNLVGQRESTRTTMAVIIPDMQTPRIYVPGNDPSSSHDDEVAPDTSMRPVYASLGRFFSLACRIEPPFPTINRSRIGWTRNGAGVSSEGGYTLHVGRCDFDLNINSVQESHEGTYRCVYRVGLESRSQSVGVVIARIRESYSIGVEIRPSSPSSSSSVVIGVGRGVNITCAVDPMESPPSRGEVSVTLSWLVQRSGGNETFPTLLNSDPDRGLIVSPPTVVGVASGQAMGIRLEIRNSLVADSGLYICQASNDDNLVAPVLNTVTLTVEDQLPLTITPIQPTVFLGNSTLLTCTLTSNRDGIIFTWFVQNGAVPSTSDPRYRVTSSENMSTLNITRLDILDVGVVTCMAQDPLHLPVNTSTILTESNSFYIAAGNREQETVSVQIDRQVELLCPIRGASSMVQVSWFRVNRELFDGQDGVSIRSLENGSSLLTMGTVQLSDDNVQFQCKAEQDGDIRRLKYQIQVTIPGVIVSIPPPSVNVMEGERVQLDCKVTGRPLPIVSWLFDGKTEISSLRDNNITDIGNGTLLINPVALRHKGSYSCFIVVNGLLMLNMTMLNVTALTGGGSSGSFLGSLNNGEVIIIAVVVVVVLLLLLAAGILMVIVCVAVYRTMASTSGKYVVNNKDSPDIADFRRQPSLRDKKDNSGILSASPTNDIFDRLQSPQHMTFAYDNGSSATGIQLNTFTGASASMASEMIDSHDSTPLHRGTMATNSLFSSEEHTSAAALPNFSRENLSLGDVMGEGEFGPVLMGVASGIVAGQDKTLVAVKVLGHNEEEDEMIDPGLALVEFANQMKLQFPNIACILGMCSDMEPYYIIYEYLDQGDLKKFLLGSRPEQGDPHPFSSQHMHKIILQIANGMAYLFSQRIIHGDLATRNCLVSSDLTVKIADLGIGHDLYNGDYYDNGSQLLPIRWMPPELLVESEEGPSFSLHSDIWSFGVICWEVFSYARLPYDTYNDEEVLSMVPHGSRLRNPSDLCPPETYDIMFDCWNEIPEARPQFTQLYAAILKVEQQVN